MFEIVDEVVDLSVRTPRSCRSGIALFHSVATHLRRGGMLSVSLLQIYERVSRERILKIG